MSRIASLCGMALESHPHLDYQSRRVLRHISDCKTPAMGRNFSQCPSTDHEFWVEHFNSCRDRHCPLCQGAKRKAWVEDRLDELLPVPYFHVVFTIPQELRAIFRYAPRATFGLLFQSAHTSLLKAAASPDNGAFIPGGIAVLHTWNQKLSYHPHIHCIVPAGGLSPDRSAWVHRKGEFLLPLKPLAILFRGILLGNLEAALDAGQLGALDRYTARHQLCLAAAKDFVVYCKPPFGGPEQVLKYLGRYTHRVGISEQRIVSGGDWDEPVRFSWIDRAHGHTKQVMTLSAQDFIDRFRLHLLPRQFRKIRYFGFMGNRDRRLHIIKIRELLEHSGIPAPRGMPQVTSLPVSPEPKVGTCPICGNYLTPVPQAMVDQFLNKSLTLSERLHWLSRQSRAGPEAPPP
jgi:hypothetical protein